MSLGGLYLESNPKLLSAKVRKKVVKRKGKKKRETPVLSPEEMLRAHRMLKAYLVSRKSMLERGRTDEAAKQEVRAIQAHLDYLRNFDSD